jgi:integrase
MPRLGTKVPTLRLHKASGRAVVTLNSVDHYCGAWGTPEAQARYDSLIAQWLASGRGMVKAEEKAPAAELTVEQVLLRYWEHAELHYRSPGGTPTQELENVRVALRPVRRLFGDTPARSFGPLALRAVRGAMVKSGLARTTVNARINRVRRAFRWAVSVELIPASVDQALRTVEGLQRGRTEAAETEGVHPVKVEDVEQTLPHLSAPVAAMIRLQLLTAARAGEIMAMRGGDLSPGEPTWTYRPGSHKNQWRGHKREIPLGPKAVEIIKGFLKPDTQAYLFTPGDAVEEVRARRRESRKTKPTPSERERRRRKPGKALAARYDRRSYRQAVVRACDRAFPHPVEADFLARIEASPKGQRRAVRLELVRWKAEHRDELREWRKSRRWSPLMLRHTAATAIRAKYGLEASQCMLGHSKCDTTQIYAERDQAKARDIAAQIG